MLGSTERGTDAGSGVGDSVGDGAGVTNGEAGVAEVDGEASTGVSGVGDAPSGRAVAGADVDGLVAATGVEREGKQRH